MNYTSIVTMIMKNENLQIVLDTMAEYIQAAFSIISEDMEIIAFSSSIPCRDPYWSRALQEGRFSDSLIKKIYKDPIMKNFSNPSSITSGIAYLPDNITLKYYITLPRDTYRYAITFIAIPLEDQFNRQQQELIHSFACLIKNTYFDSKNLPLSYSYRGKKTILQKLLNRNYSSYHEADIEDHSTFQDTIFDNIQVLVLSPEYKKSTDALLHSYADSICDITGNEYATVYENSIVSIFNPQEISNSYMDQLIELASNINAKIGISWKFSGKEYVYKHYKQATFAIEKARTLSLSGYIFTYDNMFIYAILNHCHKSDRWLDSVHPVLSLLRDYDDNHDSALYDTLNCYLKCGMNSILTAQKLGIHKSTLYHRIEIIKELVPGLSEKNALWHSSIMLAYDLEKTKKE